MAEQLPSSYYKTPFLFTGKEKDDYTGLHYFGARYYDSKSSIWLSVDPLFLRYPATNPYVYCFENPINMIDPDGNAPLWIFKFDDKGNMTVINDGKNNITIETSKGKFSPSRLDNSKASQRAMAKIVGFFASKKGFGGRPIRVSMENGTAHYDPNDDSMTINFPAVKNKSYDTAANINSILVHEISKDGHRGEKYSGKYTYLQHAMIYGNQINDADFLNATERLKYSVVFGFAERVFNAAKNGEIGSDRATSIIEDFNTSNSHQIYIDYNSSLGSGSAEIKIGDKHYESKEFQTLEAPEK